MKMLAGAAKEVQGELAETEHEACILVALSDLMLPKLISGELRAKQMEMKHRD